MKVIAITLLIIFMAILWPESLFAYTANPYGAFEGPPIVCVWDSKYNEQIKEGVNLWWHALVDRYGYDGEFNAILVYGTEDNLVLCNIHIVHANFYRDGILGSTFFPKYGNSEIYIMIYNNPIVTDNEIIRTTAHELGHGFGLDHFNPDNLAEALRPWPTSLMWAYQDPNILAEIDEYTLDQFECIYGINGWSGSNNLCEKYTTDYLGIDLEFKR